jgi:hypothetical protein
MYDDYLVAAFAVWHALVLVVVGNFCDNIPRMKETWDLSSRLGEHDFKQRDNINYQDGTYISQHAEKDVNDTIGRADTAFDPYCTQKLAPVSC